jgi:RecA/RadA recombinase
MGQFLRILAPILKHKSPQTAAVFINQIRANIGFFVKDKDITPGGKALRSCASSRVQLWRKEILKKGDSAIGIRVGAKNKKNKVVTPYQECCFDILF